MNSFRPSHLNVTVSSVLSLFLVWELKEHSGGNKDLGFLTAWLFGTASEVERIGKQQEGKWQAYVLGESLECGKLLKPFLNLNFFTHLLVQIVLSSGFFTDGQA